MTALESGKSSHNNEFRKITRDKIFGFLFAIQLGRMVSAGGCAARADRQLSHEASPESLVCGSVLSTSLLRKYRNPADLPKKVRAQGALHAHSY